MEYVNVCGIYDFDLVFCVSKCVLMFMVFSGLVFKVCKGLEDYDDKFVVVVEIFYCFCCFIEGIVIVFGDIVVKV